MQTAEKVMFQSIEMYLNSHKYQTFLIQLTKHFKLQHELTLYKRSTIYD